VNAGHVCALCRAPIGPGTLSKELARGGRICRSCAGTPSTIDEWILDRPLGEGGLGVVWAVRHTATGQSAALKILRGDRDASGKTLKRFRREAQAMAALDHPHILSVRSAGNWQGKRYLVMDRATGGSMGALLKRGPLAVRWAARALAGISRGLGYAHEKGMVHRDVKPGNVLFDDDWQALLCDFGLVRFVGIGGGSGLTAPGSGVGSLAYMPPEQIEDAMHADAKSDVWALGVTFYEAVTSRLPFPGKTPLQLIKRIREGQFRRPSSLAFGVSNAVDVLVEHMLQPDLERRPTTAKATRALERLATGDVEGALPPLPDGLSDGLVERALAQNYVTAEQVQSLQDAAQLGGAGFLERLREEAALQPEQLADLDRLYVAALGTDDGFSARLDTRTRLD
jgi:serine/threonine protein kinase